MASSAGAAPAGLGSAMREEVWAIVRAAVEETLGPIVARQRELEARVERAERAVSAGAAARPASAAPAATSGVSIPVAFGPSLAPPAAAPTAPTAPAAPKPARVPSFAEDVTVRGRMPSLPPQGYGVTVMKSTRPELDLAAVGPVDIDGFDGGRRKRLVASTVVVLMLMVIIGVVTMTVLSHS